VEDVFVCSDALGFSGGVGLFSGTEAAGFEPAFSDEGMDVCIEEAEGVDGDSLAVLYECVVSTEERTAGSALDEPLVRIEEPPLALAVVDPLTFVLPV
jgi:hypothetical protein